MISILQMQAEAECRGRCQSQQEGTGWSHKPGPANSMPWPVLWIHALSQWGPNISELAFPGLSYGEAHQEGGPKKVCVGSDPRLVSAQTSPLWETLLSL